MALSYSAHLSKAKHALSTTNKCSSVSKHNLRAYKSDSYDKGSIIVLEGSKTNLMDDIRRIYDEEFSDALRSYNKGKRPDRQIHDYLKHVSESRSDVAAEIIIQIGDKDFWKGKSMEQRQVMTDIFNQQLEHLRLTCPNFRIASAVIHYDETCPHMHIVGVPVATDYLKGMNKQVAKTKIFTKEYLSFLQDSMRENAAALMSRKEIFAGMQLKPKEKGRNKDIPKQSLDAYYKLTDANKRALQKLHIQNEEIIANNAAIDTQRQTLSDNNTKLQEQQNTLTWNERHIDLLSDRIKTAKIEREQATTECNEERDRVRRLSLISKSKALIWLKEAFMRPLIKHIILSVCIQLQELGLLSSARNAYNAINQQKIKDGVFQEFESFYDDLLQDQEQEMQLYMDDDNLEL